MSGKALKILSLSLFVVFMYTTSALAIDYMYWCNNSTGEIVRAKTDGSDSTVLYDGSNPIYGIALDLVNYKLYWTEHGSTNYVRRANLNGSSMDQVAHSISKYLKMTVACPVLKPIQQCRLLVM